MLGGFIWNRKRWMRYSIRLQESNPSTKRPGNTDSGMTTEYSVRKGGKRETRSGQTAPVGNNAWWL